jgi:hypothetical protein
MKTNHQISKRQNVLMLAALTASVFLFPACRHVTYTTYQGTGPVEGTGGTVRSINGVEIWENGNPNRRYTILGVTDQERTSSNPKKYDEELCHIAQKHGGNAVIILSDNPAGKGMIKAQIVRYAP